MKWNEINTIAQKHRSPLYHILNRFINSQIESSSGVKKEKRKKNLLSKRKTQSRSVWQINAMVSHRWRVHYQPCRAYSNSLQRNGEKRMAWRVFFVSSFAARRILINRFVPFRFAATRCKGFRLHHLSVAGVGREESRAPLSSTRYIIRGVDFCQSPSSEGGGGAGYETTCPVSLIS